MESPTAEIVEQEPEETLPNQVKEGELPETKPWKAGDPIQYPLPKGGNHWEKCHELVQDFDEKMCSAWRDEVQNLLIFAGLFSAVVTAFTIESQKTLQPDSSDTAAFLLSQVVAELSFVIGQNTTTSSHLVPPPVFVPTAFAARINACWFTSLTLSLSTVLIGILCLQWLREFQRFETLPHLNALALRQMRYTSLVAWKVPEILSFLPLLLQGALILFFAGLIEFLRSVHRQIAITIAVIVGLTMMVLAFSTMMPTVYALVAYIERSNLPASPYPFKSAQSWIAFRLAMGFINLIMIGIQKVAPEDFATYSATEFNKLYRVSDWSQYDKYLQSFRRDRDLHQCFAWIGNVLTDSLDTALGIYYCMRDMDARKAHTIFSYMTEQRDLPRSMILGLIAEQDFISDHAAAGVLEHLVLNNTHLHPSLLLHRVELYIKVINSSAELGIDTREGIWKTDCPNISWCWYTNEPPDIPEIPFDTLMHLLDCVLGRLKSGNPSLNEINAIWSIAHTLLIMSSRQPYSEIAAARLDEVMRAMDVYLDYLDLNPNLQVPAITDIMNVMFGNVIMALTYGNRTAQVLHNVTVLAGLKSFQKYVVHLKKLLPILARQEEYYQFQWKAFVTSFHLEAQFPEGVDDSQVSLDVVHASRASGSTQPIHVTVNLKNVALEHS